MPLSRSQKDFLKTIKNPKDRKYQKQQFKLQNKFDKFGLGEEIIFIDGIFKTDNPELIAFFNECPMVGKSEENSLTKESLRDITEPKTRNELYSIPVLYTFEDLTLKEINVAIYDSLFSGNSIDLSFYELFKIRKEKLIAHEKEEILRKSNNQDIPKEFCVEITEENKEVLELIFREKYKSNNWSLRVKDFLHSDIKFDSLYSSNKAPDNNVNIEIVLTEEFLRYIGKEELIGKSVSEKTHKQNMLKKEINEYFNLMIEEVNNGNDYSPLLQLIEICCKKLLHLSNPVLAVGKINETTDAKPLDFDLPKKEDIDNIECLSLNDIMQIWITTDNRLALGKFRKLVEQKTNPLGLK